MVGVRSTDDVAQLLKLGADKISINTAAIQNPQLVTEIASRLAHSVVLLKYKQLFGRWKMDRIV